MDGHHTKLVKNILLFAPDLEAVEAFVKRFTQSQNVKWMIQTNQVTDPLTQQTNHSTIYSLLLSDKNNNSYAFLYIPTNEADIEVKLNENRHKLITSHAVILVAQNEMHPLMLERIKFVCNDMLDIPLLDSEASNKKIFTAISADKVSAKPKKDHAVKKEDMVGSYHSEFADWNVVAKEEGIKQIEAEAQSDEDNDFEFINPDKEDMITPKSSETKSSKSFSLSKFYNTTISKMNSIFTQSVKKEDQSQSSNDTATKKNKHSS